tara:strand:+ start:219 stop:770 length:552 start_codon:yes stop_codon:yes gene_type:complete
MNLKLFSYKKVKSTNSTAINLIKQKKFKKGIVHSISQTNGRGRYGRKWISLKGNFFLTIFFQLNEKYPSLEKMTNINVNIILNILKKLCKNKQIKFKKPNDIYINKKKVCGILQETISVRNRNYLIVGIGINLINNPKLYKYLSTNIFIETNIKLKMSKIIKLIKYKYENLLNNINNKKLLKV